MVYKKVNHYGIKFYIYEIYEFLLGGGCKLNCVSKEKK